MNKDAKDLRATREQMFLRLLVRASRAMNVETMQRVRDRGFPWAQPSYTQLLGNLDTEGTKMATLVERIGTTRQAVSQLAQEIESKGLITRKPDPNDQRGLIVHFTDKGRKMLAAGIEVMTEIEAEYTALLGESELQRMKKHLKRLLDVIDPVGTLGPGT